MSTQHVKQALCGTCDYVLVGLEENRCPECGTQFEPGDSQTFNATGRRIGRISRVLIAAPAWPVSLLALLLLGKELLQLYPPERAMQATWYYGWCCTCVLIIVARAFQLWLRGRAEQRFERRAYLKRLRCRRPAWPLLLVILVAATVAAKQRWPMYWVFALSESSLDALATRAAQAPSTVGSLAPAQAGVFSVSSIVVLDDGTVILYTCERGFRWSKYGFARMPNHTADERYFDIEFGSEKFQLQRALRLTGDWFVVYDGYWAIKDGWS